MTAAELTDLARALAPLLAAELGRGAEPLRTKRQLADHFGVELAQVDRWTRAGMPFVQIDSRRRFDLAACSAWHAERHRPAPISRVVDGGLVRLLSRRRTG